MSSTSPQSASALVEETLPAHAWRQLISEALHLSHDAQAASLSSCDFWGPGWIAGDTIALFLQFPAGWRGLPRQRPAVSIFFAICLRYAWRRQAAAAKGVGPLPQLAGRASAKPAESIISGLGYTRFSIAPIVSRKSVRSSQTSFQNYGKTLLCHRTRSILSWSGSA